MPPPETQASLPRARPYLPDEDVEAFLRDARDILTGGRLTRGPYLERFEAAFAVEVGTAHAVGLHSGTAPLEIALRHWQLAGAEVVVPTNTFIASANAVVLAGGKPVLADICPTTLCSGLKELRAQVTERTAGVVAVHLAGLITPDIAAIRAFCDQRGLFLLEDAAHAHGAALEDGKAGSLGHAAAFSFYATKVLTCGEGGMLTTNDDELAHFARSFRCHGIDPGSGAFVRLGSNCRLPELSAALGLRQLTRLREGVAARQALAEYYRRELAGLDGCRLVLAPAGQTHPYYKLPLVLPAGVSRESLAARLRREHGVQVGGAYWPPCHLEPYYRDNHGCRPGHLPVAEEVLARTISLPLHAGMGVDDVALVAAALRSVLGSAPGSASTDGVG